MRRILMTATMAAIAVAALAGCKSTGASNPTAGGGSDVVVQSVEGNWFTEGAESGVALVEKYGKATGIALVLGGSGTKECAPQIEEAKLESTTLAITLKALPENQVCTADYRPYNFTFSFAGADKIEKVSVDYNTTDNYRQDFAKEDFAAPQK